MIKNFISEGVILCGNLLDEPCPSLAPIICQYLNDCNNHGTCCTKLGKCICDVGFYGADCLKTLIELKSESYKAKYSASSDNWFYFSVDKDYIETGFIVTVESDVRVALYLNWSTKDLPDISNFDVMVKAETQIQLSSSNQLIKEGAIIAIHCIGT